MFDPAVLRLYLVLDPDLVGVDNTVSLTRELLDAGITYLQLRWKSATDRQVVSMARSLQGVCRAANAPLIINDRLDLALAAGADGVHLGADDLPIADARRLTHEGFIVGYSPEDDADLVSASSSATYLGIGPFQATSTKSDAGPALGSAEFARRRSLTALPVVAIGGIGLANATKPLEAGADGIAVVSSILKAEDPVQATRQFSQVLARLAT
jgi:thiamine-phosphate diphosphorylase